jgi:hypothetical protein
LTSRRRLLSLLPDQLKEHPMKRVITLATTVLFAVSLIAIAASNDDALMKKEKAAWQAFKDKDADGFKKIVATDYVGVYDEGMMNLESELAGMQKWDMKSFAISEYKVMSQGSDVAISTYTVKLEGTANGKDASGTYNAATVWKKQKRDWQAIFHTNVKQAPSS